MHPRWPDCICMQAGNTSKHGIRMGAADDHHYSARITPFPWRGINSLVWKGAASSTPMELERLHRHTASLDAKGQPLMSHGGL